MKQLKIILSALCVIAIGYYAYSAVMTATKENTIHQSSDQTAQQTSSLQVGAERMTEYLPLLQNKNVAIVGNQTSVVGAVHLVDTLLRRGVSVKKIYTPEHGFRGTADAGATIGNSVDAQTGLPIVSLYGTHKKPTVEDLQGIDIVVFDIQDVGARFYTYISTMHYVMEACAENHVPFLVLDRPNPNGFYVDGPVLKPSCASFVGMHPVPIVHGMTIAEYARMINGEHWLKDGLQCELHYVLCSGYDHSVKYTLPIPPSPNLPNMQAVYLYPTLCLFEGTELSCGRGTDYPFQVIGHPQFRDSSFSFIPRSKTGAQHPLFEDKRCYGYDFRNYAVDSIHELNISIWQKAYKDYAGEKIFFNRFFVKLSGTPELQKFLELGSPERIIRESWKQDLDIYRQTRQKYLLYKDF